MHSHEVCFGIHKKKVFIIVLNIERKEVSFYIYWENFKKFSFLTVLKFGMLHHPYC